MKSNYLYPIMTITLAVVSLGIFAQPAHAQLSGAIWTTTHNGRVVNGNIYKDKCDVYLNGGPGPNAPIGAAGLPTGWYYFMVTDPSGKVLLSNDAITERRIWVSEDGVFVEKDWAVADGGDDRTYPVHVYNDDRGEKDGFGAIVVQLCPYDDTPNNGGVYKAWITPVGMYGLGAGKHGFIPRWSKTDNFKVGKKRPPDQWLYVRKFKDCNANGQKDTTEDWLTWDVKITPPEGLDWLEQTPAVIMAWPGQWIVEELIPSGWLQTALIIDGVSQAASETATVAFGSRDETHYVDFGNIPMGCITACKFYDSDNDGIWDIEEPGIEGVKMTLTGQDVFAALEDPPIEGDNVEIVLYTGVDGCVRFEPLFPGTYTVTETPPPTTSCNWVSTTDITYDVDFLDCDEGHEESVEFGNVITGTACFSTKGYWHNKNGLTELTEADGGLITFVNSLAPYSSASTYFGAGDEPFNGYFSDSTTPVEAAFNNDDSSLIWGAGTWQAEVSHFLIDSNAGGDPREQLAQQLLAFIFNVRIRLGSEEAVILEPSLWEGSASDLINAAITAWIGGSATDQTNIKNILDGLNNRHCDPGVEYILPLPPESCVPVTY